ncbi:MAG: hypothetical protein V4538_02305 [Bacteroidota bacterium]
MIDLELKYSHTRMGTRLRVELLLERMPSHYIYLVGQTFLIDESLTQNKKWSGTLLDIWMGLHKVDYRERQPFRAISLNTGKVIMSWLNYESFQMGEDKTGLPPFNENERLIYPENEKVKQELIFLFGND